MWNSIVVVTVSLKEPQPFMPTIANVHGGISITPATGPSLGQKRALEMSPAEIDADIAKRYTPLE